MRFGIAIKFRIWQWRLSLRLSRRQASKTGWGSSRQTARHPEGMERRGHDASPSAPIASGGVRHAQASSANKCVSTPTKMPFQTKAASSANKCVSTPTKMPFQTKAEGPFDPAT